MAMDNNEQYSPLVRELQHAFNRCKDDGDQALFVCAKHFYSLETRSFVYIPVQSGVWPWSVFDNHPDIRAGYLEKPMIAFDLTKEFAEQFPESLNHTNTIDCFGNTPLYHIADRTGVIPAQEQAKFHGKALRRTDHLRLVK